MSTIHKLGFFPASVQCVGQGLPPPMVQSLVFEGDSPQETPAPLAGLSLFEAMALFWRVREWTFLAEYVGRRPYSVYEPPVEFGDPPVEVETGFVDFSESTEAAPYLFDSGVGVDSERGLLCHSSFWSWAEFPESFSPGVFFQFAPLYKSDLGDTFGIDCRFNLRANPAGMTNRVIMANDAGSDRDYPPELVGRRETLVIKFLDKEITTLIGCELNPDIELPTPPEEGQYAEWTGPVEVVTPNFTLTASRFWTYNGKFDEDTGLPV